MLGWTHRKVIEAQSELEKLKQQNEKLKEEHVLLADAVKWMGLNPTAIVDEMRPGGDSYLRVLPFRMVSVVFDIEKAAKSELSENKKAYVLEAIDRVRMPPLG